MTFSNFHLINIFLLIQLITFNNAAPVFAENITDKKTSLDSVCNAFYVEQCCKSSLKSCLSQKSSCPIALHLYNFGRYLSEKSFDQDKILELLGKRYTGFTTNHKFIVDTYNLQWAGSDTAKVRISAYISSTCSMCKFIVGALYDSVTTGSLYGKAKLVAIPFGSGIGDRALFAANSKGKFWELLLEMRKNKIRYQKKDILQMGKNIGLSPDTFNTLLQKPQYKKMLMSARSRGSQNEVKVTPTFFINEKAYHSYKDPKWVVDAAIFEYNSKTSK